MACEGLTKFIGLVWPPVCGQKTKVDALPNAQKQSLGNRGADLAARSGANDGGEVDGAANREAVDDLAIRRLQIPQIVATDNDVVALRVRHAANLNAAYRGGRSIGASSRGLIE